MKKFAAGAFAISAALVLAACGSTEGAKEEAQPDSVEMLAEEAVPADVGTPVADASAEADAAAASSSPAPQ